MPPSAAAAPNPKNTGPKGDAVRYPQDRRQAIWVRFSLLAPACLLVLGIVAAAWTQFLLRGLPHVHVYTPAELYVSHANAGFPA